LNGCCQASAVGRGLNRVVRVTGSGPADELSWTLTSFEHHRRDTITEQSALAVKAERPHSMIGRQGPTGIEERVLIRFNQVRRSNNDPIDPAPTDQSRSVSQRSTRGDASTRIDPPLPEVPSRRSVQRKQQRRRTAIDPSLPASSSNREVKLLLQRANLSRRRGVMHAPLAGVEPRHLTEGRRTSELRLRPTPERSKDREARNRDRSRFRHG
jgi:hypothetical protein